MTQNKRLYNIGLGARRWISLIIVLITFYMLPFSNPHSLPALCWVVYAAVVVALSAASHVVLVTTASKVRYDGLSRQMSHYGPERRLVPR